MTVSVLVVVWSPLRGGWRCVWMGGGVECAAQGGTTRMPLLCAGNWDTLPLVGGIALLYPHNKSVQTLLIVTSMFRVSTRNVFWATLWLLNVWCLQKFWAIPALYITAANATLPVGAVPYSSSNPLIFGLSLDANLTSFRCYGSELHLLRCTHSAGSCSRYNTAGVLCYGDVVPGLW